MGRWTFLLVCCLLLLRYVDFFLSPAPLGVEEGCSVLVLSRTTMGEERANRYFQRSHYGTSVTRISHLLRSSHHSSKNHPLDRAHESHSIMRSQLLHIILRFQFRIGEMRHQSYVRLSLQDQKRVEFYRRRGSASVCAFCRWLWYFRGYR